MSATNPLAFSTLACIDWTLEQVAEAAAAYGYDAVELRGQGRQHVSPEFAPEERATVRRLFAERGLAIVAVSAYTRFAFREAEERRRNVEELRRFIDLAADLGAPVVRTFGGVFPEGAAPADVEGWITESLAEVAPQAIGAGVQVGLEAHDELVDPQRLARVLGALPAQAVGLLWDVGNPHLAGYGLEETWAAVRGHVIHTHLKDARRDGDGWTYVLLGEGEVPVAEAMRRLVADGYGGAFSLEWERAWHPELAPCEEALPPQLATMRRYLREAEN
jgi:sugar phosphate isomerase/epimerase